MKTVFLVLLLVVSLFLLPSSAYTTMLADCLENVYKLDKEIAKTIINRLSPIINTPLIREFIDLSRNVSLETKTSPRALIEDDACLKTPDFHRIIFENDSIRILDISSNPGKKIPLHTHQWNDIIIVIQGSLFEAEDIYGNRFIEDCPIEVGKSEGSTESHAYTNIGSEKFQAISFEFKD